MKVEEELWAVRLPGDRAYRLRQEPGMEDYCLEQHREQGIRNVVEGKVGQGIAM